MSVKPLLEIGLCTRSQLHSWAESGMPNSPLQVSYSQFPGYDAVSPAFSATVWYALRAFSRMVSRFRG